MCWAAELVPLLVLYLRILTSIPVLYVLRWVQDWVSDEQNFSPLSNWKWACNYKLAVLIALGENQSFEIKSWRISVSKADPSISARSHLYLCACLCMRLLIIKYRSLVLRLLKFAPRMQMVICQARKCFKHLLWIFAECRGLKSRAMVMESIQCTVNTPLQPDAMPGVKPLFTAEVNKESGPFTNDSWRSDSSSVWSLYSLFVAAFSYALSSYCPDLLPNYAAAAKDPHREQFVIFFCGELPLYSTWWHI